MNYMASTVAYTKWHCVSSIVWEVGNYTKSSMCKFS